MMADHLSQLVFMFEPELKPMYKFDGRFVGARAVNFDASLGAPFSQYPLKHLQLIAAYCLALECIEEAVSNEYSGCERSLTRRSLKSDPVQNVRRGSP
jgi:hypothetical protein